MFNHFMKIYYILYPELNILKLELMIVLTILTIEIEKWFNYQARI